MKSARAATDPTVSDHVREPSFDLSSYVAASRGQQDEMDSRPVSPGTVAFCAAGALAVVPLTSAHAAIVTKTVGAAAVDVGGTDGNEFVIDLAGAPATQTFEWGGVAGDAVFTRAYKAATNLTVGPGGLDPVSTAVVMMTASIGQNNFAITSNNNYVPVKFQDALINGGNTVYGWAQIDVQASSQIVRIVYSDIGRSVNLNNGVFTEVVPEPSTLALMATGAAGVLALRRKRRQGKRKA